MRQQVPPFDTSRRRKGSRQAPQVMPWRRRLMDRVMDRRTELAACRSSTSRTDLGGLIEDRSRGMVPIWNHAKEIKRKDARVGLTAYLDCRVGSSIS